MAVSSLTGMTTAYDQIPKCDQINNDVNRMKLSEMLPCLHSTHVSYTKHHSCKE